MIICGWGKGVKSLGEGFFHACDNCNNTRRFIVAEKTQQATVFFVPVAKFLHEYYYVCPVCTRGIKLLSLEVAQRILAKALIDAAAPDPEMILAGRPD